MADTPSVDLSAAVESVNRLVESWRSLQFVGAALSQIAGLQNHKDELALDVVRLQSARSTEQIKLATAEIDARDKIAALKKETADAEAALKEALDKHGAFMGAAETKHIATLKEQKRLDAALAETREKMKTLAATAGG